MPKVEVTELRDLDTNGRRFYASKHAFLKRFYNIDTIEYAAVRNEVLALSKLKHENIVPLWGSVLKSTDAWLCYPRQIVDFREMSKRGSISIPDVIYFFHQLLNAVEYIHANKVIHCDIKLENLVLSSDYKLKIIDFDLAREFPVDGELFTDTVGTKECEAPEMNVGWNASIDIWCMGLVLEELVYGTSHKKFLRGNVNNLDNLIAQLKQVDPTKRIGHVGDMVYNIGLIRNHESLASVEPEASCELRRQFYIGRLHRPCYLNVPDELNISEPVPT